MSTTASRSTASDPTAKLDGPVLDTLGPDPDRDGLLPVRMLNEFAYCPRLFHLMHVEGRWADNVYTVEGKVTHRRVDALDHVLPEAVDETMRGRGDGETRRDQERDTSTGGTPVPHREEEQNRDAGDEPPTISRSVPLDSAILGLSAKLDLVSTAGEEAVPVETKRGRVPKTPERCYEPERVQLMAQGLLLREHGYQCDHGVLYFAGSRTRVDVPFTPELEARTRELIVQARQATARKDMPPPLDDSPKCCGCSLNAICLPDETTILNALAASKKNDGSKVAEAEPRRLYPVRDDALPFYVQEQGASIGKTKETLVVRKSHEEIGRARLKDVSQVVICGNVSISAQTVQLLCEAGIPIVHLSYGHWFYGITHGITLRNAYDRAAQFKAAEDRQRCLEFARSLVAAKGSNQRTMLRRNGNPPAGALEDMTQLLARIPQATAADQLLGMEGNLAAIYFRHFSGMLRPKDFDAEWDFATRNRRPPRDPVNAMLSFGYALLTKEATVALLAEGLEPWWGLYHQPRHGRPSLALDLMEPFRPLVVDSAVVTAVNTGMVRSRDFVRSANGCMLNASGRKALIRAYEARLDQLVTHPVFEYRCAWRAIIRVQARLLARWMRGDVPEYESVVTR